MLDNQLIEIMRITHLHLIYCYTIDSKDYNNLDKSLAVELVYGNKKKLVLDYKSPYFPYYLNRIKEVYNKEKDKYPITFFSDFSKEIIENYNINTNIDNNYYTTKNIFPINTSKYDIEVLKSYIIQALESIFKIIYNKTITNINIIGYRNKYVATYNVGNIQHIVSLYLNKMNDSLLFKIGGINGKGITVNGNTIINNEYVVTNWKVENTNIEGKIYSDIENDFIEEIIDQDKITVYYDRIDNKVNSINKINDIINPIIGINFDKCIKTNKKSYLLKKESKKDMQTIKDFCHIVFEDNFTNIIYTKVEGYMKYDDTLFIPTIIDKRIYNIINLNNEKLVQEYNFTNNKYSYKIFNGNNLNDFDISNYDSIEEIKNRGDNSGPIRRI